MAPISLAYIWDTLHVQSQWLIHLFCLGRCTQICETIHSRFVETHPSHCPARTILRSEVTWPCPCPAILIAIAPFSRSKASHWSRAVTWQTHSRSMLISNHENPLNRVWHGVIWILHGPVSLITNKNTIARVSAYQRMRVIPVDLLADRLLKLDFLP